MKLAGSNWSSGPVSLSVIRNTTVLQHRLAYGALPGLGCVPDDLVTQLPRAMTHACAVHSVERYLCAATATATAAATDETTALTQSHTSVAVARCLTCLLTCAAVEAKQRYDASVSSRVIYKSYLQCLWHGRPTNHSSRGRRALSRC